MHCISKAGAELTPASHPTAPCIHIILPIDVDCESEEIRNTDELREKTPVTKPHAYTSLVKYQKHK